MVTVDTFEKEGKLKNLPSFRRDALDESTFQRVTLFNGKFWDLLALYKGQWHYITTIKNKIQ